ncbi:thiamine-phosphate kinase [Dietzia psychralcaliphila]|uniref:Thiamine-monophosphate kinase n=1 Tax=Dietzia psychralcaliphila TaxID=139021 RepID=A0AAD0JRW5_9ACTN|nr:thiamine-phosphate kinase [Dietzia psychralcaliphila]AWH95704.1 thiamine monophosphate kinase [Dietzia psychralcaliphila]PTM88525.1 thiamine-phosphate kinase [Dietzia psychralcaliphila]
MSPAPERPATVAEVGEAGVLAVLSGPGDAYTGDPVGNGDDAAVLGPAAATVVTTDMLVEGTHFRLDLTTWRDIGRRAVAQNVSDVLAMGADCSRVLVALAVPGETTMEQIRELAAGIHGEAARSGAVVVGGDLTSAHLVVVSVTAIGTLPEGARPLRIDGAAPGDRVALTGEPGRSAAGLALLLAGHADGPLQQAHRVPVPPIGSGRAARLAGATSLTDVSDGLMRDLSGMARASGVAADLVVDALPVDPRLGEAAAILGRPDPGAQVMDWILDGGEDHGLLGTFPTDSDVPAGFTVIGTIRDGDPGEVSLDGHPRTPGGWDSARGAN